MLGAIPPGMTTEQLDRIESSSAEDFMGSLIEKLGADSLLLTLLAKLLTKNANIALDLNFFMGSCQFPHRMLKEGTVDKEGTLIVSLSLRQDSAGLYWPDSTNSVRVAEIHTWERGVVVKLCDFDTRYIQEGERFNRIIQKAAFTRVPRVLSSLSLDEVQAIFNQVIADISDVFREYSD